MGVEVVVFVVVVAVFVGESGLVRVVVVDDVVGIVGVVVSDFVAVALSLSIVVAVVVAVAGSVVGVLPVCLWLLFVWVMLASVLSSCCFRGCV